jgi:hypothetical protein
VDEKGSPFKLVTEVDREAERVIVDGIVAAAGATVLRGVARGCPGVGVMGANPGLLDRLAPVLRDAGFELISA